MEENTFSTSSQQTESTTLTGKKHDLVTKYLSDMVALQGHVYQAIDKQVKGTQDEPDARPVLTMIRDGLERQVNELRDRLNALGGQASSPLKEAGASILGVAAGVIDKVRSEEVSKEFRDNYAALSLSNVSYVMLMTTCLACNDNQTADLVNRHLTDNARYLMEIGKLVPHAVVRDLKDESDLNPNAAQEAQQRYIEIWKQN